MAVFDLMVVGSSVLDVLVPGDRLVEADGDAWTARNVHFLDAAPRLVLGGNGAATAYAAARSGARVSLETNLGNDDAGNLISAWLVSAGVTVVSAPAPETAVNVVSIDLTGRRRSTYFTGHSVAWHPAGSRGSGTWCFAAGYGGVAAGDFESIATRLADARSAGIRTAFDPGPWFTDITPAQAFAALLPHLDLLLGTQNELSFWLEGSTPEALAQAALEMGASAVAVKMGATGAIGAVGGRTFRAAGERVEGGSTVGAGDTFNGVLLAGLSTSGDFEEGLRAAVLRAGRAVASGRGVLGGFEDRGDGRT